MPIFESRKKIPLGIYIHVPFCRSKCQYCDFYSLPSRDNKMLDGYLEAVCAHIKEAGAQAPDYLVDTVYFGGGTPSYFGGDGIAMILTAVRKYFRVAGDAEITVECNPDSVTDHLLRRLRSEGVNRISLGIQCDDDVILKRLGRAHTYQQAVAAVERIRAMRFRNLSVDLMYGLPGQTLEMWLTTLQNVLKLQPEHISCYGLKVEEGTPLYEYKDCCNLADDELQAEMYLQGIEVMRTFGYRQYEISNFCRKGRISRHNMKYWTGGEYLGFGPAAASDFGGRRYTAKRDLHGYIDGIKNKGTVMAEVQDISRMERAGEYIMMRLRTVRGIDPEEYEKKFMMPFDGMAQYLRRCQKEKFAVCTYDGHWHLTAEGMLVSNSIISDLLLIQEKQ